MKIFVFILFLLLVSYSKTEAQQQDTTDFMMGYVREGDTIIHKNLMEVWVHPEKKFKSRRQYRRYSRYVQRVKKVYPMAKRARELLVRYEPEYYALEEQRDRRKLMRRLEKELLSEHKEELRKWSISDGRVLLKLINRETERTPYRIIKDFRGDVSAVFWQGIAKLFKNNLKAGYDPEEEDRMLEEIVTLIELGYL